MLSKQEDAASVRGSQMVDYASWNGATSVAAWRVLAGGTPDAVAPKATRATQGFETALTVDAQRYVATQALGANGRVLAQSATVSPS